MQETAIRDLHPAFSIEPGPCAGAAFGDSMAVDGNRVLIGATTQNVGRGSPCALLGQLGADGWTQIAHFTPRAENAILRSFAGSVALAGATVAIAQWGTDMDDGPVDIFEQAAGWSRVASVVGLPASQSTEGYGQGLRLSGQDLLIGHPLASLTDAGNQEGVVHHFRRTQVGWTRIGRLSAPDSGCVGFGASLALEGTTLAVGSSGGRSCRGAVYIFERRSPSGWAAVERVDEPPGEHELSFGEGEIVLVGDRLVVGAQLAMRGGTRYVGAVYVFERKDGRYAFAHTLLSPEPRSAPAQFGAALDADATRLVIAELGGSSNDQPGRVWLFPWSSLTARQRLTAPGATRGDLFGVRVRLVGDRALVAATADGDRARVHVFDLTP